MVAVIAISLDCILIGIVVESIAISSDRVSMDVDGVSMVGLTVGSKVGSTWLCWAIDSAKSSTAQTSGFYGYQPRGINGLVVK